MNPRFLPPLAVLAALSVCGAVYFLLTAKPGIAPVEELIPTATSTEEVATSTDTQTDTTAEAVSNTAAIGQLASVAASAAPPLAQENKLTAAGALLLKSTVNILCVASHASGINSISGTGVVIDSRGLILTAAHIGQYFLLTDYPRSHNVVCTIRTGAPAANAYFAAPVYVSPSWVKENAGNLSEAAPKGTGENDFAVLAITASATKSPLPDSYPFLPLSNKTPFTGEKVAISGYAAEYLNGSDIQHDLYPTIVFDAITNRYTLGEKTVDVISVAGSAAAQEGSSGGGIADEDGNIVGVITTSSTKGDISEHVLNAITPLHMRASFLADSDTDFDAYLTGTTLPTLISNFKPEAHTLAQLLVKAN